MIILIIKDIFWYNNFKKGEVKIGNIYKINKIFNILFVFRILDLLFLYFLIFYLI